MPIVSKVHNGVCSVEIAHPPVNALTSALWHELADILEDKAQCENVHAIVLSARGKGFCAGVDIRELEKHPEKIVSVNRGCYRAFRACHRGAVPVIGVVHGFCVGGGVGLIGGCDMVVGVEGAYLALPEIDRGAMGGAAHLSRLLPLQKVRYLFFTGTKVAIESLAHFGSVEHVAPTLEKACRYAYDLAETIASKSPIAVQTAKEALNSVEVGNLEEQYRREQGLTLEIYTHKDSQEGRSSFVEKRSAHYDTKAK